MNKLLIMAGTGLAVLLAAGCGQKTSAPARVPVSVLVARAVATNIPVLIEPEPVGHVTPLSTVTIRPQIGGIISSVKFQEGQEVRAGELLFMIDSRPMEATLDQARANLLRDTAQMENSKIQFVREQKLFDQKLVSQDEYDTSRAAYDALVGTVAADGAAVTNAQLNLEFTQIRSPIDGRTGALQFHEGNVVKAPDDTLVTLNQIHPIYVQFGVPEQFLPEIKREMEGKPLGVTATFQGLEVSPPRGELTFIDNAVDAHTGMIQLRARFANEDSVLWPGQYVQVHLTLSELTNAVVVPSQAVQTGQNGQYAYVVKPDQTVEERPITIGVNYQGWTVVKEGVQAGETVVTDGQLRLVPGTPVTAKDSVAAAAAP